MYRSLITEATGVTDPAMLARIEDYMRNVIFHSTLDWQSRRQLFSAARTANREIPMLDAMMKEQRA